MHECNIRQFTASDGYTIRYRHWTPRATPPVAYVVALHGIQSHSGWYEHSSRELSRAGIDLRFLDRRGSGLNAAQPGHALHWQRLTSDIRQFLHPLRTERDQQSPQSPIILLALSWGGKPGAMFASQYPDLIDGLALLYPGIYSKIYPGWWQRRLLSLAVWYGYRKRLLSIPLTDPELFTSQPDWQQFIRDDSLALHRASAGLMNASCEMDRLVRTTATQIRCPVLIQLAARDRIVDNAGLRNYFARLASDQKTLIEYPNSVHTLEFEPDRDMAIADLTGWITQLADEYSESVTV